MVSPLFLVVVSQLDLCGSMRSIDETYIYMYIYYLSRSDGAFTCVVTHPSRPELLLTGSQDGRISVWDRRNLSNSAIRSERWHTSAG